MDNLDFVDSEKKVGNLESFWILWDEMAVSRLVLQSQKKKEKKVKQCLISKIKSNGSSKKKWIMI